MERIGQKTPLKWFIREWRKKKGLTLDQVADRLDTNRGQISKLERGDLRMNDNWISGIAEALGVEPADLLRNPHAPTRDELLRGLTPEQETSVRNMIQVLTGKVA